MTAGEAVTASRVGARLLALAYLVGFGLSTLSAVAMLLGGQPSTKASAALGGCVFALVLALAAATIGIRSARSQLHIDDVGLGLHSSAGLTWRRIAAASVIYVAVLATSAWVTVDGLDMLGIPGPSGAGAVGPLGAELLHGAAAGLVEEFVLLALPIAVAARCGWSTRTTLAVLIVMRLGIHVYVGWHALFVVPWMAGALIVWRWCPLVWPFVVGHGIYDVLQVLGMPAFGVAATATFLVLLAAAAAGNSRDVAGCRARCPHEAVPGIRIMRRPIAAGHGSGPPESLTP
jgi:hypothetical protein